MSPITTKRLSDNNIMALIIRLKVQIERKSNDSELHRELGNAYYKNKKFIESKLAYERAGTLDPKDPWNLRFT